MALAADCTFMVFFFQAEDGIRDYDVTGVQTCALPISVVVEQLRGFLEDRLFDVVVVGDAELVGDRERASRRLGVRKEVVLEPGQYPPGETLVDERRDRKSTRLNSSHVVNSYAVFCLKKKILKT